MGTFPKMGKMGQGFLHKPFQRFGHKKCSNTYIDRAFSFIHAPGVIREVTPVNNINAWKNRLGQFLVNPSHRLS